MVKYYFDKKGYKRFSNSDKLIHRHVAEQKLGRKLKDEERVHHINRDKSDNRRSNLWVFKNQDAHECAHKTDKKRFGKW